MSTGSYVEVTGGESQPGKDDPPFKRASASLPYVCHGEPPVS